MIISQSLACGIVSDEFAIMSGMAGQSASRFVHRVTVTAIILLLQLYFEPNFKDVTEISSTHDPLQTYLIKLIIQKYHRGQA
jgi:hypothetical protein